VVQNIFLSKTGEVQSLFVYSVSNIALLVVLFNSIFTLLNTISSKTNNRFKYNVAPTIFYSGGLRMKTMTGTVNTFCSSFVHSISTFLSHFFSQSLFVVSTVFSFSIHRFTRLQYVTLLKINGGSLL